MFMMMFRFLFFSSECSRLEATVDLIVDTLNVLLIPVDGVVLASTPVVQKDNDG